MPRWNASGFTFTEVLVALTLFTIALPTICSLQLSTLGASARAQQMTVAGTVAQQKIEELSAGGSLTGGSDVVTKTGTATVGGEYTRAWTVTDGPSGTRDVRVTVTWLSAHGTHSIELATLRNQ